MCTIKLCIRVYSTYHKAHLHIVSLENQKIRNNTKPFYHTVYIERYYGIKEIF